MRQTENVSSKDPKKIKTFKSKTEALKVILIYVIIGALWIALSDRVLVMIFPDPKTYQLLQSYKGWFYVLLTGIIFYVIIYRRMHMFEKLNYRIAKAYRQLKESNDKLTKTEDVLNQRCKELEESQGDLGVTEQRYKLAIQGSNDGIWDWNIVDDDFFCSTKFKSVFSHMPKEDGPIKYWDQYIHPDDLPKANAALQAYLEKRVDRYEQIYRVLSKNNTYRWIHSRGKALWDENGKPIRMAGSHTDITPFVKFRDSIKDEKELLESIFNRAPIFILLIDGKGTIVRANPFSAKILGYRQKEMIGKSALEFLIPPENQEKVRSLFGRIKEYGRMENSEVEILDKNGQKHTILWNNNSLYGNDNSKDIYLAIGVDVTEHNDMTNKLHQLAYYDPLTGLPNRFMIEQATNGLIEEAEQEKNIFAFIYLDVDNFKYINDTMGHEYGDRFLKRFADILSQHVYYPHVVGRMSGDEFYILLVGDGHIASIMDKIAELYEQLKRSILLKDQEYYISASMGVAFYPEHGINFTELARNADTAMFFAKEKGKGQYVIYSSLMEEKLHNFMKLSNQIRSAIDNNGFFLVYQPQIELQTGKMIGMEALIRLESLEGEIISPIHFIPFAEENGLIEEIDQWVFTTACKQHRKWAEEGHPPVKMCINLSAKTLMKENVSSWIAETIEDYGISSKNVEFEITETAFINDFERALKALKEIKRMGFTIALDDFGTGYSSLTYLQQLPIDILKIDRGFIQHVMSEYDEVFIFESIVNMAHHLGLRVVVEGIETVEQRNFVEKHHCDIGQGYYYAKPMPEDQLEEYVRNNPV